MVDLVEASYDYSAQNQGDMTFKAGQRIEVEEHLSESWARGKNSATNETGVFPKNYVRPVAKEEEQKRFERPAAPLPPQNTQNSQTSNNNSSNNNNNNNNANPRPFDEKQQYQPPPAKWQQTDSQAPPNYNSSQQSQQQSQPPSQPQSPPFQPQPFQQGYQQPYQQSYQPPYQQQPYQQQPYQQQPYQQQYQSPPQPTQNPIGFFMPGQQQPAPPPPQPQPQSQPQQQQDNGRRHHGHFGQYARRFGDSVSFGAGSTLGADIINKIF